jgi:geranylgeranyl diphosphate synthase type 3
MNRCDLEGLQASFFAKKTKSKFQALLEPFKYITSNPGKEIRGKLIEAFNIWLNVPPKRLQVIAKIVNMLHAASLM